MRKLLLLLCLAAVSFCVHAQVDLTATGGTLSQSYTTLKGAFDAINAGTHTGVITIGLSGNTTETASAVLNASGSGAASYTSIAISPSGGAARSITGSITAGNPLIDLNGADNVTFDGLNTGGNLLTIENTTASATSGTSTLRFIGGATNNTITNCFIKGSSSSSVASNGGTIFFSTDAVTANGNDNNTISNCDIGPSGSNLPSKAILGNGSTTTTAIGNSGIIINNNNIHDYFGAAVTSSGIATNGGCNTWTITDNKFYQSATRTWTIGAAHRAIDIANTTATSGAQGFTITGNIIGYASNTQTGTYTLTGAGSGAKFVGIAFNGIITGTTTAISNNTIAAVSMTGVSGSGTITASPFTGILFQEGVGVTNNNTIGSLSSTGALTFSTTTTSATDVFGILNFSSNTWTSSNNNVGGISVTNLGASGTFLLIGMRCFTGTTVAWTAASNTVGGTVANSIQLTATGTASQVIGMFTSNAPATLTSNTVRNLTTNIGTGTITTASLIGIAITNTTPSHTLSQNTIYNLSNTNATAASVVTGIQFTGASANIVERNLIYGLTSSTTSTAAEINGIRIAGGTTTYRNNMIAIGAGVSNAVGTASSFGITGILEAGGNNNIWHNSVYIGGTATAGVGPSWAFVSSVASNTRSYRNNIFFNARTNSGATGKHYVARVGGTVANPAGLTINNNLYYANGTGAVFGYFNSLDVASLSAWQTVVGQDAQSVTGYDPQFIDPTNATPNLHIHATNPTVIEGSGASVAVTDDFDGQTRSGLTPVDIGADGGNFVAQDAFAPIISYTALGSAIVGTNQTLTATITDVSGVGTGAGLPTLYYKVNAGVYSAVTGVSIGSNQYTFTFGSATTTPGDVVSYYIVAQDIVGTPNVGAFPSAGATGFTSNPPAASTPPATPSTFTTLGSISGTKTIGSGGDYATITAAIADLNTKILNGALTLNLIDAAYAGSETFPLTINANLGSSASNTVTIKATQASTTITGSSATALFVLNGADYVTIDGSISSTVNTVCPAVSASRDLTITNTNVGTASAVVWLQTATADGATNNTIKNCNLVGSGNTQTLYGVGSGSSTISATSLGNGNNNNSYINNNISKTQVGIYSQGAAIGSKNTGTIIRQNLINTVAPNNVQIGGIRVGFESGIIISGNNIANMFTAIASAGAYGISLGVIPSNTYTTLTGNEVVGAEVSKNVIDNIVRSGDGSSFGIVLAQCTSTSPATNVISNNMISGVRTTAASPQDAPFGIEVGGGTGATNVYHNTVVMTGVGSSTSPCFGLAVGGSNPVVDIRNNIFVNKMTSTSGEMYAMTFAYSTYTNLTSDNNNFFTTADSKHFDVSVGAFLIPTNTYALAAWKTASGKDGLSKNIDPTFISASNLHIDNTISANLTLNNAAATGTGITDDIDCGARGSLPDIGADQFGTPGFWIGVTSTDWNTITNWDDAAVPTSGADITVPAGASNMPALDMARTINNLFLGTSATVNLNAQILTINGGVTGAGTLTGSSTSSLVIGGTAGTLNFTSGSRTLKDLTLSASATATLGTALDITGGSTAGTVTIGDGGTLTTGGNLTLKSDANGTARIASLNTGVISGNVTQERYIPAKFSRTYTMAASPFTQSIGSAWQQQVHITGTGTGGTVCPILTAHSNGFDATLTNAASMFVYDGTKAAGSRWTSVTGTTGVNLTAGTGYRMNIRGPRSLGCSLLDGSVSTVSAVTLSSTGALNNTNKNYGSFSISLPNNGDASVANDNYLLTGNPYPSQISFSALQTANSGVITNAYATFAPGNTVGNYAFWNGATWTGGSTGLNDATGDIIANGQAFFVKGAVAGAGISLNWIETMKTASVNNGYFRQLNSNRLRIGYILANGNKADEIMIQFAANATNDKLNNEDVVSINAGTQHLKSIKAGNGLAFNTRDINFTSDTVQLNVVSTSNGTFKLSFYDFDAFVSGTNAKIYLLDNFTGTTQLMNDSKEYSFAVNTANAGSQGMGRFSVVFNKPVPLPVLSATLTVKAYPNPVGEQLNVELPQVNGGWILTIMDMNGRQIIQQQTKTGTVKLNTSKLAKGTYTLQAIDSNGNKQVQKLVKQ